MNQIIMGCNAIVGLDTFVMGSFKKPFIMWNSDSQKLMWNSNAATLMWQ